jgi:hypothetical protein
MPGSELNISSGSLKPSLPANPEKAYRIENSGIAKIGHEVKMSVIYNEGDISSPIYLTITSDKPPAQPAGVSNFPAAFSIP